MKEDLDSEIAALKERERKLQEILSLRGRIVILESQALNGTDSGIVIKAIAEVVCDFRNMDLVTLMTKSQAHEIAHTRHEVWFLCREIRSLSFQSIGTAFKKDHGTIIHGAKMVKNRVETDRQYSQLIDALKEKCIAKLKEKNGYEIKT